MKRSRKIMLWSIAVFILLLLLLPIIGTALHLEFTNPNNEDAFESFRFFAIPIAILLTLVVTIRKSDKIWQVVIKIIATFFVALFPIFLEFTTALDGLCSWTTDKVLFENKKDPSVKIVLRDFGCGAVDSSPATPGVYKIEYFTSHVIRVSDIDTAKINKDEWVRVDNK